MRVLAIPCLVLAGCVAAPPPGQHVEAQTFPNDQPAFDYFVAQGLAPYQAAGIVGNLDVESGVDPTAVQPSGPGRGIAQWLAGGRWDTTTNDNAVWYAGTLGQSADTLSPQLQFIWYELTTFSGYGLAQLRASTDVSSATIAFMSRFEGCSACSSSARIADAQNVLALYGGDHVDLAGATHDAGTACTIGSGESGVCIDTAACAALGDHVSTPGYCPGAANIECCTATGDAGPSIEPSLHHPQGCDAAGGSLEGTSAVLLALLVLRRSRGVV